MKIIKSLSLILLVMAVGTTGVYAYDFENDGIYYNILSSEDRTVEVTATPVGSDIYSGDVVIPQRVINDGKTYSVTTIGGSAFYGCSALTSVSMPSVTTIGEYAFYSCDALTSVSMPAVTTIGDWAFFYCRALASVSMPEVTTIGARAFGGCSALTSVDIPASCTSIAGNPFQGCQSLEEIVVDENNPNYSSADGVLYDKDKTTLIGWPTAEGEIDIMPEVTTIGKYAFSECYALASVSMPSVTTIGDGAFSDCLDLTSVDIPASCTSIAGNPFQGCQSLEEIVVDENNPNYSSADGVLYDKDKTTLIGWPTAEGEIDIMPSVTTIGDSAFNGCSALTSVSMPSVTTIGESAFYNCSALTSVEMPSVTTIGNSAFSYCRALASVSMPAVTTIGLNAFFGCDALHSVSMPEVTTIGNLAFYDCYDLTSVSMPSVTTIGVGAFEYCSSLTSIDIPASVTMIGDYAFYGCSSLTSVYCHWEQPLECYPEFEETVLANATLYVPDGCVDAYRAVKPWSEFANIEEGGYSGIADSPQLGLSVKVIDGAITVEGGDGTASAPVVEVYSAGGQCVYRGTDTVIGGLGHGIYVVKVGGTVQKVAL